jgi:hypothetical protein
MMAILKLIGDVGKYYVKVFIPTVAWLKVLGRSSAEAKSAALAFAKNPHNTDEILKSADIVYPSKIKVLDTSFKGDKW